jgi:hypothetical protein
MESHLGQVNATARQGPILLTFFVTQAWLPFQFWEPLRPTSDLWKRTSIGLPDSQRMQRENDIQGPLGHHSIRITSAEEFI